MKMAVQAVAFRERGLNHTALHTGQHSDFNMSELFFRELEIPSPAYHLGVSGGSHGQNTGRMIVAIEKALLSLSPSVVVLYGDTDTTLAGAVATSKLGIRTVHIESGLRSLDRSMPEEINRVVADVLSDILYAPTQTAMNNLAAEGIAAPRAVLSGDIMLDALRVFAPQILDATSRLVESGFVDQPFALLTLHRPATVDVEPVLRKLITCLGQVDCRIVFVTHPRTQNRLREFGILLPDNLVTMEPQGYFATQALIRRADVIFTDSGGLQKEAFFHQVPSIVFREKSEWVELSESGASILVGTSPTRVLEGVRQISQVRVAATSLFGDGFASQFIARDIATRQL